MKQATFLRTTALALILAVGATACGSGNTSKTDSLNQADKDHLAVDTAGMGRDTAPGAEIPPGAINPGEDSARYGTGTQDSSKNRTGQK